MHPHRIASAPARTSNRRSIARLARSVIGLAVLAILVPFRAESQGCDSVGVTSLPLIERPGVADSGDVLVVLMTGDGGWANADEQVAKGLVARGGAVVGLNMRAYLERRKSPDALAEHVTCIATVYMLRWRRPALMLLGYSRGADMAPFVAARLPSSLRERVTMVAMVSPGQMANFQFHLIDLIRDVRRADDVAVLPEVARIRDLRVVCVYGSGDRDSVCPLLDSTRVQVIERTGGHRVTGGFDAIADVLTEGLKPRPFPPGAAFPRQGCDTRPEVPAPRPGPGSGAAPDR